MSNGSNRIETYEDFVKVHGLLLAAAGIPQSLHRKLFQKLATETFDGGAYFQIEPCEDGRQRRLLLTADSVPKESEVFLVDHAWTFRLPDAYKQVRCSLLSASMRTSFYFLRSNRDWFEFVVDQCDSRFRTQEMSVNTLLQCVRIWLEVLVLSLR